MENNSRRNFLKTATVGGVALATGAIAARTHAGEMPLVYVQGKAGAYEGKTGSHAPKIKIEGSTVTVTTEHVMTKEHYISLHSLTGAGMYFGAKEIGIKDLGEGKVAVSTYDIGAYKGPLKAISICNLHDVWMTEGAA